MVADPITSFIRELDTSLRMAEELLTRGIEVDYCNVATLDLKQESKMFLSKIPVQKILEASDKITPLMKLAPLRFESVNNYHVILQRKDPPVDLAFRQLAAHFSKAPSNILQINNPSEAVRYSEHEIPIHFPEYSTPTELCESLESLVHAVRQMKGEAVVKPFDQCSGIGIEFFKPTVLEGELKNYWEKWQPKVIVQPYLDEVTKSGDLRILTINNVVLGQVLRVVRPGSRLANLHQGASFKAQTPSARQLEATRVVSESLTKKGLFFLGLDFIGDYLNEVNITCPSALPPMNEVMGIRSQVQLIDEIEKLRKAWHA